MSQKENFHSFNTLRFFSFLIVFLSHLPYVLFNKLEFFHLNGAIGVRFFFILSGFLITYILLYEKSLNNSINFKRYFIRRILRIWPMYYLILLFAFVSTYIIQFLHLSSSNVGYQPNWLMSCFFLENYQIMYHNDFANVSPLPVLWSVCIEEHFYIIWVFIIAFCNIKKITYFMFGLILVAFISRFVYNKYDIMFKDIFTNIDYFMYGAFPAYLLVFKKEKTILIINKIPIYLKLIIVTLPVIYVFGINLCNFEYFNQIEPLTSGLFFSMLLFILLPQENKLKISDKSIFSNLGVYTYSLYLNHVVVINLMIQVFKKIGLDLKVYYFLFIFTSLFLTIFASKLTFVFIEKPFLNLKKKFN